MRSFAAPRVIVSGRAVPFRAGTKRQERTGRLLRLGRGPKKSPGETGRGDKACLTLPEHCDIPPPNVRVWRNW
ncbi:hypothetical protein AGR1C_Cc40192 [Agrobacterium fabacearum TT111]|nr:hypothetical protein AGR1C_Cc40192 [Agrobacterium fabacearum TT111]